MTKNEFLSVLSSVLEKNQVSDAAEIIEEYEQHFSFKLADGYSEEEIAAKLGNPEQLAQQFERGAASVGQRSGMMTKIVLGFFDIFVALFYLLLAACGVVILIASIAFIAVGICMLVGASPYSLIPAMPYLCSVIIGIALAALGVLTAVGCKYYWALMKQLVISFCRFQRNTIAAATGAPVLPALPAHVRFEPKTNRRLRTLALIALLVFAMFFVLGYVACALSAGSLEFWHVWGWFVN